MKLEINYKKKTEKHKHVVAKQHATNNEWINNEIKEEIQRYTETNETVDTRVPNLWDTVKAVIKGDFTAI